MVTPWLPARVSFVISLIAAAVVLPGLKQPLYIAHESTTPITDDLTIVTSAEDVADLLAGTQISAQAAADLTAILSQRRPPAQVIVATYDHDAGTPETPDDALDRALAAGLEWGIITQEGRTDANILAVTGWADTGTRKWRYLCVLQSSNSGLITSGKPVALADAELPWVWIEYHDDDTEPAAAGMAGFVAGANLGTLAGRATAALGAQSYVDGVALPDITNAEAAFAFANDVGFLINVGNGSSAAQRIQAQVNTYGGSQLTSVVTMMYLRDRTEANIGAVRDSFSAQGILLDTGTLGQGAILNAAHTALWALTEARHFRPGQDSQGRDLPDGWIAATGAAGSVITLAETLLLNREATEIDVSMLGEVA